MRAALDAHRTLQFNKAAQAQFHRGRGTHQHTLLATHGQGLGLVGAHDDVDLVLWVTKVDHLAVGAQAFGHATDQVQVHRQVTDLHGEAFHTDQLNAARRGRQSDPIHARHRVLAGFGRSQQQRKVGVFQRQADGIVVGQRRVGAGVPIRATHAHKGVQVGATKGQGIGQHLAAVGQQHFACALFKTDVARDGEILVHRDLDVARSTHQGARAALEVQRPCLVHTAGHFAGLDGQRLVAVVHHGVAVGAHVDGHQQRVGLGLHQRQADFGGRLRDRIQADPAAQATGLGRVRSGLLQVQGQTDVQTGQLKACGAGVGALVAQVAVMVRVQAVRAVQAHKGMQVVTTDQPAPGVDRAAVAAVGQLDVVDQAVGNLEDAIHRQELAAGERHAHAVGLAVLKVIGIKEHAQGVGIGFAVGRNADHIRHRALDHLQTQGLGALLQFEHGGTIVVTEQAFGLAQMTGHGARSDQSELVTQLRHEVAAVWVAERRQHHIECGLVGKGQSARDLQLVVSAFWGATDAQAQGLSRSQRLVAFDAQHAMGRACGAANRACSQVAVCVHHTQALVRHDADQAVAAQHRRVEFVHAVGRLQTDFACIGRHVRLHPNARERALCLQQHAALARGTDRSALGHRQHGARLGIVLTSGQGDVAAFGTDQPLATQCRQCVATGTLARNRDGVDRHRVHVGQAHAATALGRQLADRQVQRVFGQTGVGHTAAGQHLSANVVAGAEPDLTGLHVQAVRTGVGVHDGARAGDQGHGRVARLHMGHGQAGTCIQAHIARRAAARAVDEGPKGLGDVAAHAGQFHTAACAGDGAARHLAQLATGEQAERTARRADIGVQAQVAACVEQDMTGGAATQGQTGAHNRHRRLVDQQDIARIGAGLQAADFEHQRVGRHRRHGGFADATAHGGQHGRAGLEVCIAPAGAALNAAAAGGQRSQTTHRESGQHQRAHHLRQVGVTTNVAPQAGVVAQQVQRQGRLGRAHVALCVQGHLLCLDQALAFGADRTTGLQADRIGRQAAGNHDVRAGRQRQAGHGGVESADRDAARRADDKTAASCEVGAQPSLVDHQVTHDRCDGAAGESKHLFDRQCHSTVLVGQGDAARARCDHRAVVQCGVALEGERAGRRHHNTAARVQTALLNVPHRRKQACFGHAADLEVRHRTDHQMAAVGQGHAALAAGGRHTCHLGAQTAVCGDRALRVHPDACACGHAQGCTNQIQHAGITHHLGDGACARQEADVAGGGVHLGQCHRLTCGQAHCATFTAQARGLGHADRATGGFQVQVAPVRCHRAGTAQRDGGTRQQAQAAARGGDMGRSRPAAQIQAAAQALGLQQQVAAALHQHIADDTEVTCAGAQHGRTCGGRRCIAAGRQAHRHGLNRQGALGRQMERIARTGRQAVCCDVEALGASAQSAQ